MTIKKKSTHSKSVESISSNPIKIGSRKNKHPIYLKLTDNKKTGIAEMSSSDGKDQFCIGTHDTDLLNTVIAQISSVSARGRPLTEGTTITANGALAAIIEIAPQDSVELMLASQMVAVHNISMEMSAQVMLKNQTAEGVDANINRITKLMRTYTAQVEALNKYRNKGQQKITVQHVNVENGGQAIVGDVNQGGGNV